MEDIPPRSFTWSCIPQQFHYEIQHQLKSVPKRNAFYDLSYWKVELDIVNESKAIAGANHTDLQTSQGVFCNDFTKPKVVLKSKFGGGYDATKEPIQMRRCKC
jgi:hypothetical protein